MRVGGSTGLCPFVGGEKTREREVRRGVSEGCGSTGSCPFVGGEKTMQRERS